MRKMISMSIWFLLLTSMQAKEYPVLLLGVTSIHGPDIGTWERHQFLDGLEHELARRGHIKLVARAPFLMEVSITGYSKNFATAKGTFLGAKQYRFKQNVRLEARYEVFDRRGYALYHGTLPYNVRMDTGSSISYADAMRRARENMLEGIGERVGERINDRFHFMVDFERQLEDQYVQPKKEKKSSYKKSTAATVAAGKSLNLDGKGSVDIKWESMLGKEDMHFFKPLKSARFGVVKGKAYKNIGKNDVKRKKLSSVPIMVLDTDRSFRKGTVLVFKTAEGHYGKMQVLGFKRKGNVKHYYLRVQWEIF